MMCKGRRSWIEGISDNSLRKIEADRNREHRCKNRKHGENK
jgi:hypothetical protein